MNHHQPSLGMSQNKVDDGQLAARLAAIEASSAWALARRLSQLRQRLAPEGSWRLAGFRLAMRGLRLWWREGTRTFSRRAVGKLMRPLCRPPTPLNATCPTPTLPPRPCVVHGPDRTGGASVPTERKFRIAFIGPSAACEAQSMRYRAHNVIAALALAKREADFLTQEEIPARLPFILSHDLIVLVRMTDNENVAALVEAAQTREIPVVYDIDDYLFEPWILPYVEAFRSLRQEDAVRATDLLGACLKRCDYFTGSTPYLAEKAEALGKKSFVLHNGLNATQIHLSRQALEQRVTAPDGLVRLGYFSGTRTHQADFRIVYPALMTLLRDAPNVRLMVVGDLDLDEFPGLAPFAEHIEILPLRNWRELPAAIAGIDINLIPLELTPFNEGKSNLKYFEAGLLKVPSIASPTRILRESITHEHNGLLARTTEEWYDGLQSLVARTDWRQRLGQNAFDHVLRHYAPATTSAEAMEAYRQIIRIHRAKRGIAEHALNIVILLRGRESGAEEPRTILQRANELAIAGHAVTVLASPGEEFASAAALKQSIAESWFEPLFAVQRGGEIPCCDVLMATDARTVETATANEHRAHLVVALIADDDSATSTPDGASLPVIRQSRDLDSLLLGDVRLPLVA